MLTWLRARFGSKKKPETGYKEWKQGDPARLGTPPLNLEGHPIGGKIFPPGTNVVVIEVQACVLEVQVQDPEQTVGAVTSDQLTS